MTLFDAWKNKNRIKLAEILDQDLIYENPTSDKTEIEKSSQNRNINLATDFPNISIGKILNNNGLELLRHSGDISRTFGSNSVEIQHLFYALIQNQDIKNVLKEMDINPKEIQDFLDKRIPKTKQFKDKNRYKRDLFVSTEVEQALKNSIRTIVETNKEKVRPLDIWINLLESQYPSVNYALKSVELDLNKLIERSKDASTSV